MPNGWDPNGQTRNCRVETILQNTWRSGGDTVLRPRRAEGARARGSDPKRMRAAIRPRFEQAVDPAPAGGRTAGARSASGVTVLRRVAPGRVRLDVAGLYRCDFLRELIEAELRRLPAVEAASGSVLTGHVLMMFGQGGRLDEVIGRIDALCRRQLGLDRPPGVGIVGPKARPIRPANAPGRTVRRPAPTSAGAQKGAHCKRRVPALQASWRIYHDAGQGAGPEGTLPFEEGTLPFGQVASGGSKLSKG